MLSWKNEGRLYIYIGSSLANDTHDTETESSVCFLFFKQPVKYKKMNKPVWDSFFIYFEWKLQLLLHSYLELKEKCVSLEFSSFQKY